MRKLGIVYDVCILHCLFLFINGVLNNQSYICNNKEELIGLLKADDWNKQRCQRLNGSDCIM